jgi:AraC family transcriptional activator of mtrCDE
MTWEQAAANEIPYQVIVSGRAILEDTQTRTAQELVGADIVPLPHGAPHVL